MATIGLACPGLLLVRKIQGWHNYDVHLDLLRIDHARPSHNYLGWEGKYYLSNLCISLRYSQAWQSITRLFYL